MDFEPFVGEIAPCPYDFAPRGWALCQGQLLSINQNVALFSILGITYGGNGTTTFALPNLSGRVAVNRGQGPGLSRYELGQPSGSESVTLTAATMPPHRHRVLASAGPGNASSPAGTAFAAGSAPAFRAGGEGRFTFATLPGAGGSQPHENRQPFVVLNYVIALQGVFPPRP
ncbi:tail fiber protein [Nocardioides sp. C4-1]|uniref:phage tail protein n=1 Tax=Nocardioides sp. C4-1 TaxID=3151851 RepID=UPI003267354A